MINTSVTSTINLNVRECPSTSCKRLAGLVKDDVYPALTKSSNDWYQVNIDNALGWVSGKYVSIVAKVAEDGVSETVVDVKPIEIQQPPVIPDMPEEPVVVFDPCKQVNPVKAYPSQSVWRVKKSFQVKAAAHEQCAEIDEITIGQAIISLGETENHYQIAYLNEDRFDYNIGYFNTDEYSNHYIPIHTLSDQFNTNQITSELKNSEAYWDSWQYKRDVVWNSYKAFYAHSPILAVLFTAGLLLSILYMIPFTRGFARSVVLSIFQTINAVFEWLVGLFLRRKIRVISSHWNTMVEGLSITPSEFYDELKNVLEKKQLPNSRQFEIKHKQGGLFSPKRQYLRVTRENHAFDICGAPFGNGTFFSWWLVNYHLGFLTILYSLPILYWIAVLLEKAFKPETYYRHDSMSMFQGLVHGAVLEVVDQYTNEKGLSPVLSDDRNRK